MRANYKRNVRNAEAWHGIMCVNPFFCVGIGRFFFVYYTKLKKKNNILSLSITICFYKNLQACDAFFERENNKIHGAFRLTSSVGFNTMPHLDPTISIAQDVYHKHPENQTGRHLIRDGRIAENACVSPRVECFCSSMFRLFGFVGPCNASRAFV